MAEITTETIQKMAKLAKLTIAEEDMETTRKDFTELVHYFDQIKKLETETKTKTETETQESKVKNENTLEKWMREDEISTKKKENACYENTLKIDNGMFVIPNTLDQNEK